MTGKTEPTRNTTRNPLGHAARPAVPPPHGDAPTIPPTHERTRGRNDMDPKRLFESRLLDSLINEIVVETALDAHASVKRSRGTCIHCGQKCSVHDIVDANSSENGRKTDYYSNNPLFECLVCSRQVSSNRYATHLEKCMGLGNKSMRKVSSRSAKSASNAVTQRLLNTNSRSSSPAVRTTLPRKRGASPVAGPKDKQVKPERSTPIPAGPGTPMVTSHMPNDMDTPKSDTSKADTTTTPTKPPSVARAPSVATNRTDDDDFEEIDFPTNLSISSESDDDGSAAAPSDADEMVPQVQMDEGDFDLEEEYASDNDTGDVDLDGDLLDSDNDDMNL